MFAQNAWYVAATSSELQAMPLGHIPCGYQLMVDNLMDLTHETYVHPSSIGQKEIDNAPNAHKVYSAVVDFITPETETSIW